MVSMNVFGGSAFESTSLTAAVDKIDYVPGYLSAMNLFVPRPTATYDVFVDRREKTLGLIPSRPAGAPNAQDSSASRSATSFKIPHIGKESPIFSHELQDIRRHGSESELENAETEILLRMGYLRQQQALTAEYHALGAINGLVLDADGTTVIADYYAELGETRPAAINFEFSSATVDLRDANNLVMRQMVRSGKGALALGTSFHALCDDQFYDSYRKHPSVKEWLLNQPGSHDKSEFGGAFKSFYFDGITFHNYRGTDDNSTVSVPTGEARFFPVGAGDTFVKAIGPSETLDGMNSLGQEIYADRVYQNEANPGKSKWVKAVLESHVLPMCTRPEVLRSGIAA